MVLLSMMAEGVIHRHIREIDISLAIVGGPAAAFVDTSSYVTSHHKTSDGTESVVKSIHWPRIQGQSLFYGGW